MVNQHFVAAPWLHGGVQLKGSCGEGDVSLGFQATRIVVLLISDERFRHGFPLCHGAQAVEINLACRAL
jgi:hypothetical protein